MRYQVMTVNGVYGSPIEAPDDESAEQAAEAQGDRVVEITDWEHGLTIIVEA